MRVVPKSRCSPGWLVLASLITVLPVLAACGSGDLGQNGWTGTVRDSAGIVVVSNEDQPLWGEGDAWTFTKLVQVGERDGPPEYQFGALSGFVMLSDGRLVIADMHSHNIRFFSPDGTYLNAVGQHGEGPGEFSGFINLLLGPGDTVLALDLRTQQGSRISPDGEWIGSFSTLPDAAYQTSGWDDDEISRQIVSLNRPLREANPEEARTDLVILRDLHGAFLDTVASFPARESITGTGDERLWHNWKTGADFDLCDGMLVTAVSDAYRFVWQNLGGSVDRIVTLERDRVPFTDGDRELFLQRVDSVSTRRRRSPAEAAWWKSRMRFEEIYPAWRRFVCGPAGSLLVQRVRPVREFTVANLPLGALPPGGEWEAFDREGRFLGVVHLPTEPHRHAFYRDPDGNWLMAGIETDELEVEFLGTWRIDGLGTR